jgi:hypothetical protein
MASEKVSLSLPADLLAEARSRAQGESLSAYVADGLRRRILADRQRDYLEEWEAEHGTIPEEAIAEMEALWPA